MSINTYRSLGRAIASALVATVLLLTGTASANPIAKTDNPWHMITNFETDADHGHVLRQSPFDTMSTPQLAAVPRGNRIHYNAPSNCVPSRLKAVLKEVAKKYGPITVNSTVRSPSRNRKIGGKRGSLHLKCAAIDFRVHAPTKGLISFLRKHKYVGGYKRYKSGFYHIDTGPKRTW